MDEGNLNKLQDWAVRVLRYVTKDRAVRVLRYVTKDRSAYHSQLSEEMARTSIKNA